MNFPGPLQPPPPPFTAWSSRGHVWIQTAEQQPGYLGETVEQHVAYWILGNLEVLAASGVRPAEADKPEISQETVRNCQRAWIKVEEQPDRGRSQREGP